MTQAMRYSTVAASIALIASTALASPVQAATPGADRARVALAAPAAALGSTRIAIPLVGQTVAIELVPAAVRAPDFAIQVWRNGALVPIDPPPSRAVVGHIVDDPGSTVAGSATGAGYRLRIRTGADAVYWLEPVPESVRTAAVGQPIQHRVRLGDPEPPGGAVCGLDDALAVPRAVRSQRPGESTIPLSRAEIAFDVDHPYHVALGSDLATTVANVEGHLAVVDAHYARDALITYSITRIIVRETPFYFPDMAMSLLDLFRAEWNTNQVAVPRDIAHLMTGQPAPGLAGLAFVGVVCNTAWAYGWSVDSSGVLSHELGHNWNAGHCHDTTPCNNMCGACLYIAPVTSGIMAAFRDSRTCLDPAGPHPSPLDPYAYPDTLLLSRAAALARTPQAVDVLANDFDGNCDPLTIASHDPESQLGAAVTREIGTGPGGRDQLAYTPGCSLLSGSDRFEYVLDDGNGGQAIGPVTVRVLEPSLVANWTFDDGGGSAANDAAGWRRHGVLSGGVTWDVGRHGGALAFDGIDGTVTVPPMNIEGSAATVTAWIRRRGPQTAFTGLVFSRAAGTTAGLHLGNADELRYTWADGPATYNWNSGLVVADDRWSFVALIVTPTDATIILDDGVTRQSAVNTVAHARQTFAGDTAIGQDPTGGRWFDGWIDDVRIYDYALSPTAIDALARSSDPASGPYPPNGAVLLDDRPPLTWVPGLGADSYDVYFGADYDRIRNATPTDPEFLGNQIPASRPLPDLPMRDQSYFWRVDTHRGAMVLPGDVWRFTYRGVPAGIVAYWPLDDLGTAAVDATANGHDGVLLNGPSWTTGPHTGALDFDGVDDRVSIPSLDLPQVTTTIATWLRRRGDQNPWAGIVFSRAAGTTAGFNFGNLNELRYHWSGGNWGWDSTLVVPDGAWVLVALVVEPDRATIYLHDGVLQSAINLGNHGAQSFAGETFLGLDPNGGPRSLRGSLDDTRIYDHALDPADIDLLYRRGGPALAPRPFDAVRIPSATSLQWTAGPAADSHDVYFGDDPAAVGVATTASPEFRGNQPSTSWPLPTLRAGRSYYWRIDERVGAAVIPGRVWRFALTPAVANSLRAVKTATGEPHLSWDELGGSSEYEVGRCPAPTPCTPTPAALVGPAISDWIDPLAVEPELWYRVEASGPCAPQ